MAEAKTKQSEGMDPEEMDPRHRMAQRYLKAAHDELAAKDAEKPKTQRQRPAQLAGQPKLADLRPSISGSTFVHGFMMLLVITGAALGFALCYSLLNTVFVAGRVIALPVGIVIFIGLSYASAMYLGIIESTSHGHTNVDDALTGDWRDWFWTTPASWGVLLMTVGLGWLISRLAPESTVSIIGVTVWLGYPILQLSTLETGSPAAPVSLPVLRTLATRSLAWMSLFAVSFVMWQGMVWLGRVTWRDPPYLTMLWMGPLTSIALLIYAWLLGQLARWLTIGGR